MHSFPTAPPGIFMDDGNKPEPHGYGVSAGNPQADGLVLLTPIWEGAGSQVQDVAGGNTGTLSSSDMWAVGPNGPVLSFNGVDQYVNLGSGFSSANGTVIIRVQPSIFNRSQFLITDRGRSSTYFQILRVTAFAGNLNIRINSGNDIDITGGMPFGPWYDIAVTWGSGGVKAYINGVLQGSNAYTGSWTGNGDMWLGGFTAASSNEFEGNADTVSFHNRAFTPSEITKHYTDSYALLRPAPMPIVVAAAPSFGGTSQIIGGGMVA